MISIIFDVDTQNDMCNKKNKVSHDIIKNIENVLITALRNEIVIMGSVIAHENNLYGYCTVNTFGQEKINETMMVEPEFYYNVANTKNGIDLNVAEECWQIIFEKQIVDIWDPLLGQPDNIQSFLRHENVEVVYIVGINFEDNIVTAIEGFINRQYKVIAITDAIWFGENCNDSILGGNVIKITTKEFIDLFEEPNG
jgi:nicotinamidase-related amidase